MQATTPKHVCECGHSNTDHSHFNPFGCCVVPCECSHYRELPSTHTRLSVLEANFAELRTLLIDRLDLHSQQLELLAGVHRLSLSAAARERDLKMVRGALTGYATTPLLLEALARLVGPQ